MYKKVLYYKYKIGLNKKYEVIPMGSNEQIESQLNMGMASAV